MKQCLMLLFALCLLTLTGCGGIDQKEYDAVKSELEASQTALSQANEQLESLQSELDLSQQSLSSAQSELEASRSEYDALRQEYDTYKEQMAPFEALSAEEAEARKIAAQKEIEAAKAEEEAKAAEAAAEKEKREKQGYDTGITFKQLARTPDDYVGEKVKFKGKVLQVIEGSSKSRSVWPSTAIMTLLSSVSTNPPLCHPEFLRMMSSQFMACQPG